MDDTTKQINLTEGLNSLRPKTKEPPSTRVLDSWIAHAETDTFGERGGRLAWLVASTIVTAMLQQVVDGTGKSRFSLKGGTLLQHRLGLAARATKDLDGIVRGDIEDFVAAMDKCLQQSWGPIDFRRTELEIINTPAKLIKPRSFEVILILRGQTWRRIKVEISPDEGNAGSSQEEFAAPSLAGFGLPTPDYLVGLAMSYQIAQKVHAASDPHDPPEFINERPRDVIDLLLLKELVETTGEPNNAEIKSAIEDIFTARGKEALALGRPVRTWPIQIIAHSHWNADYTSAATSVDIELTLDEAVGQVNAWLGSL